MLSDVNGLTQLAFSLHENRGIYALLLGSGFSRSAGIPTGWEVTNDLIRRYAKIQNVETQLDWSAWYERVSGEAPSYSKLVNQLGATADERRAILHGYIEPTGEDRAVGRKLPTKAHRAVADLVASGHLRVIITTNFDRLLENALRDRGIEPTVVSSVDALVGAEPIAHSKCYVLKIHGDYRDARILNTESELGAYPEEYDALLDRILDEYGLIISGWSGEWDHALRSALMRARNRRYSTFWSTLGTLGTGAQEIVEHRKANVIVIESSDAFFAALADRVHTLDITRQQNPGSIELLIASAKRLMVLPHDRIRLHDLLSQETESVLGHLHSAVFESQEAWDLEAAKDRVVRYESAVEGLASACGVLGRWGDDRESGLVLDVLYELGNSASSVEQGYNLELALRWYPNVLVLTCYALGLVRAGRLATLARFMNQPIRKRTGKPRRIVESLFLTAWEGSNPDLWCQLLGQDHKQPLSEHLLKVALRWGPSRFLSMTADIPLLFERYEILGSFLHINTRQMHDVERELNSSNGFVFMPVGRSGWNSTNAARIFEELETFDGQLALTKAGFFAPGENNYSLFKRNFDAYAHRLRW